MIDYPKYVKSTLSKLIDKMATEPKLYVNNPTTDFTRKRKLSFETVMYLMLSMGGNSLSSEFMEYFKYNVDMPSTSAFIQQRDKIKLLAVEFLLYEFTNSFQNLKLMMDTGYLQLTVLI